MRSSFETHQGTSMHIVVGIFTGGSSSRMGAPKGLLPVPSGFAQRPGETLLSRTLRIVTASLPRSPTVLVGENPSYRPFAVEHGLQMIGDAKEESGPLAGIVALLDWVEAAGFSHGLVLSNDLPFLTEELVGRLAQEEPQATILAPATETRYEPLFARYALGVQPEFRAALTLGRLSLQPLLRARASILALSPRERERLIDWDTPEDRALSVAENGEEQASFVENGRSFDQSS